MWPKAAHAIPLLSATRLLSPSVAQVVAQGVYISIIKLLESCAVVDIKNDVLCQVI